MTSRTNRNDDDNSTLKNNAIRLARVSPRVRATIRNLINNLDAEAAAQSEDPAVPPQAFVEALRRPKNTRRQPVHVLVDGKATSLLLNPQGKADPEREASVWAYVRDLVRQSAA